jgi:two-component system alkaline phosphatase synthesis response regulator PhoP
MNPAPPPSRRQVLIVEDEAAIRELVRLHLSLAGYEVTDVGDGKRALDLAGSTRFDLIVLDLMLPGLDGITLCRALRADSANRETAILMLTAKDTESDKVLGLESGADDYMTKPFGVRELIARVGAILRRSKRLPAPCCVSLPVPIFRPPVPREASDKCSSLSR